MEKKHKRIGDFPTNARIKITYPEKGDPKIDFEYPDNKRQLKGLWASSGVAIISMILTIFTITIIYLFIYTSIPSTYPTCIIEPISDGRLVFAGNVSNLTLYYNVSSIVVACGKDTGGGWIIKWDKIPMTFSSGWSANEYPGKIFPIFVFAIFVLVLYFGGIYFYGRVLSAIMVRTKFGKKHYPGWNKFIHNKHFTAEFTKCPDNLEIELPLFGNIYMDYETEEEFADYLKEVEIKEHDVKYRKTKFFYGLLTRKNPELVPNVYLWKATFRFKKKPTKGFLKVNFT